MTKMWVDLDGDLDWSGPGEFQDDSAFNAANELLERELDTDDTAGYVATYVQTHNKKGDLTDDGRHYKLVYDPFGRLRFVKRTDNQAVVAEYRYNGLGFRVGWHYDVDADGTVENTADDPWFFFAYDEGWRMVATYRSTDSSPKEQFVHHMAGLGGYGGSSYIDAVILRERDANTTWASAADGTLEERLYYCQNWRADVVAMVTSAGVMVEWVKYSAYGVPFGLPAGDTDSDGDYDGTDVAAITGGYDVRKDVELDGDVDAFDITSAGGAKTLGRGALSDTGVANRKGYAGYELADELAGAKWHVRHRFLDSELGRWTRRDPLGYVDGISVYEYASSMGHMRFDPYGLASTPCASEGPCGGGSGGGSGPIPPKQEPPTSPWPGMTTADCTKCAMQAMADPKNAGLIAEIKLRGCPFGFSGCEICGPGNPPLVPAPPAKAWWDGASVRICADRMPSCEYVKTLFAHEVWHAYDRCQYVGGSTCCDCVCKELRSYRWDEGCADGGIRRGIPGPDGKIPESEEECLRIYVNNSCSAIGYPCYNQPTVFDDCFKDSFHDPRCYPSSIDPPPIWIIPHPIFGVTP